MRFGLAILVSKIVGFAISLSRRGSGSTWPGHVALKVHPRILKDFRFQFSKGIIVITGTNGKTTTAKLCHHVLGGLGYKVLHNKSGGNILNGIASTFVNGVKFPLRFDYDFAVLEVDEFVLPELLTQIHVNVLILLNLSRDQLDRYGEIDIIVEKWVQCINDTTVDQLLLSKDEKHFAPIASSFKGLTSFFDADAVARKRTLLLGDFNSKNVNAAMLSCMHFGIDQEAILLELETFTAAYGRGEIVEYYDKFYQLFLAKNPASFNNNLDILIYSKEKETIELEYEAILFVLNDEIRDGRDVSWIYDINPVKLLKSCINKTVYVSGTRAYEMALRLQYAGVVVELTDVDPSLKHTLDKIHQSNVTRLVVLPNYSAMLHFRKLTLGKEIL